MSKNIGVHLGSAGEIYRAALILSRETGEPLQKYMEEFEREALESDLRLIEEQPLEKRLEGARPTKETLEEGERALFESREIFGNGEDMFELKG